MTLVTAHRKALICLITECRENKSANLVTNRSVHDFIPMNAQKKDSACDEAEPESSQVALDLLLYLE